MKTLIISCALLLMASVAFAQSSSDTIVVAPGQSGLYFYHIVQKGESLASLSQQFGLQQDALSRLNNTQSLQPYEMIKIPLAPSHIVQNGTAAGNKNLKPLYHKVLKGETLFRVGKLYGDVPLDQLRQWNNMQGNNVGVGQYLIIGWLKKPSKQTDIAQTTPNTPNVDRPAMAPQSEPQPQQSAPETTSSSEGHAFLREVIAAERHHARNKRSLATETAVSRPLLSGVPESPGPSPSGSRAASSQAVSQPLLAAGSAAAANNSSPSAPQTSTPPPAPNTNRSSAAPTNSSKQQVPAAAPSTRPAEPVQAVETKTTPTDHQAPAKRGGQEAKDKNPFEKMLNQIAGQKEKARPSAAKQAASSKPAAQTSAPPTGQQPERTASKPSGTAAGVSAKSAVNASAEKSAVPAPHATTPAANTQSAALPLKTGATGRPSPDSAGRLPAGTSADSATLHLAQKSEFQELYLAQTQGEKLVTSKKGAAGWFKSNVKPGSKKYYALCNDLPRGTIIKVVNPINKRFVYVKVLSSIPEQKENYNLIIKLSDAAMEDLGTHQPRFWSQIVYPRLKD